MKVVVPNKPSFRQVKFDGRLQHLSSVHVAKYLQNKEAMPFLLVSSLLSTWSADTPTEEVSLDRYSFLTKFQNCLGFFVFSLIGLLV